MINKCPNHQLAGDTTFAIPASCRCYIEYDCPDDIPAILSSIPADTHIIHIGGGSNMLFTKDYPGYVLHSAIKGYEIVEESESDITVKVGAGEKMDDFVLWACNRQLWGIENLSGIPGEVGASAVQNVGAYGSEAADTIVSVNVYDCERRCFARIPATECAFGYRDSIFKQSCQKGRYIIHSVVYKLSTVITPRLDYPALKDRFNAAPKSPLQVRDAILSIRDSKLPNPANVPSAGSYFKNPVVSYSQICHIAGVTGNDNFPHYRNGDSWKLSAAWLIDQCGWKGRTVGNVAVWHLQPLVIVNPERKATAAEVLNLEKMIQESVYDKFGVELTPEVEHI